MQFISENFVSSYSFLIPTLCLKYVFFLCRKYGFSFIIMMINIFLGGGGGVGLDNSINDLSPQNDSL